MQRYELVEGTASKFWEVDVAGTDVTVRFGRIGTAGQTQTKAFADASAARKAYEKLVKEKTGKGYGLVAGTGGTLAAVAPKASASPRAAVAALAGAASPAAAGAIAPSAPAAVAIRPANATATATAPATAAATTPADLPPTPLALDLADEGFQWTPSLLAALPVFRGVRAPATDLYRPGSTAPAARPSRWSTDHVLLGLATALGKTWTRWEDLPAHLDAASLARGDADHWLELVAQAWSQNPQLHAMHDADAPALVRWLLQACKAHHGFGFALETVLQLFAPLPAGTRASHAGTGLLDPLREIVAAAPDDELDAMRDAADLLRGRCAWWAHGVCYVFPHEGAWCQEAAADPPSEHEHLLAHGNLPPAEWMRYLKGQRYVYWGELRGGVLLQIRLRGRGALEVFPWLLERSSGRDETRAVVDLLLRLRVPGMVDLLVTALDAIDVREAAEKLARDEPAAVLAAAIRRLAGSASRSLEGWTVRLAQQHPEVLARVLPALEPGARGRFESLLGQLQRAEADAAELPPVLREPPWLGAARQGELPVVEAQVPALPDRIHWDEAMLTRHRTWVPSYHGRHAPGDRFPKELSLTVTGIARLAAGEPLQAGDVKTPEYAQAMPGFVLLCPERAQLPLWNSYPAGEWAVWYEPESAVRAIVARFGVAALPGLQNFAVAVPDKAMVVAQGIETTRLVPTALRAFRQLKKSRDAALQWIRAYPATTLAVALPLAFAKSPSATRDDARFAVQWLLANGFETQVHTAAAQFGDAMGAAVEALRTQDPLLALPARMPRLPAFFAPASFRRPALRSGGALPLSAVEHVGSMLAISKPDAPYAGLAIVREACTPSSLAEFAWDVFEAWLAAGAPSKEGWAFTALGLLGNDETAHRLAPKIREWPGESAHVRAVAGLDLLAAIGSDIALMHLNGIAGKVKFKALQERAKEKIAAVAEARGFTPEELADRLVPDLGLDYSGTVKLDFGPRWFGVGFDETLKPFVRDAQGARLKDLPKPNKADDAALAEAATERFKQMKKDAKAVAGLQLTRLELGMVARRRWSAGDFTLFFLRHPLMRHLAARLAWGVYEGDRLARCFRVAEDWTLADAEDSAFTLPDDAVVGIAHLLEMPAEVRAAFGQLFADYEIQQPFRQLDRETYALTDEEKAATTLKRFAHKTVATGSVLGLANRGWRRGEAQDAGWVGWFTRDAGDGLEAQLSLEPGTVVGDVGYEPKQKLPELVLRERGTWDDQGLVPFGRLDPIVASELLRDVDLLAAVEG